MAFEEVAVDPESMGGEFYQFKDIGQTLKGYFASQGPSTSKFAKAGDYRYMFATKEGFKVVDPAPAHLNASLKAAIASGKLKPGCQVIIKMSGSKPTDKGNPLGLFSVMIDPEVTPLALKLIASAPPPLAPQPQQPTQPKAPPAADPSDPFNF
jgi:hypothetical protein